MPNSGIIVAGPWPLTVLNRFLFIMQISAIIGRTTTSVFLFAASFAVAQDNVLIIIADDVGVDMVGCYQEGPDPAPTPVIDALAQRGVLFRNAWANPACSPTRSHIQTGRYGFRTGLGMVVSQNGWALQQQENTIADILGSQPSLGITTGFIGKWHLSNLMTGSYMAPNLQGYDVFMGTMGNIPNWQSFFNYERVENGVAAISTTYATTEQVDDALNFMQNAPEPWVCYLAFNTPHAAYHKPPAHLFTTYVPNVDPRLVPRPFYKAMLESMDTEMGRLFSSMGFLALRRTNVIFMGDNGTPGEVSMSPFEADHAKLTPYEGGVNVPLIITGPIIESPGREVSALVSGGTDLFQTVLDMMGASSGQPSLAIPTDSVSMLPYLLDPQQAPLRDTVFAEYFGPNSPSGFGSNFTARTVRNNRYKLIEFIDLSGHRYEFYDLQTDPFESFDLVSHRLWTVPARTAFLHLRNELKSLVP